MFLKVNWLSIGLIFALTLSILPSSICAANLDNIKHLTQPNIGSFYVDDFSKIPAVIGSKEVRNWIMNHTDIDPDNFNFALLTDKRKLSNKSNVIMFYDNNYHEIYYSLTAGNTSVFESGVESTWSISLLQSTTNRFRIVNGVGKTTLRVGVIFYRMFGGIPIKGESSDRYNLPNGGVLNYNPSPEWSHVTISIDVNDVWWRTNPDIWHWLLPLGTWHTGTIKKNKGFYLDFS